MGITSVRKPCYEVGEGGNLSFTIHNYNQSKEFSSFFPGIAGLLGIPLWCFYVNRGQCVSSFGVENKDSSIMEFQPANKAYRSVSCNGFRTFIKYLKNGVPGLYEPFQDDSINHSFEIENKMVISSHDLLLEESNTTLGLKVTVRYFTLPNESVAALAREVKIENIGNEHISFELVDGMPVIIPFGVTNEALKFMSRTIEAWSHVENQEKGAPFYRVKVLIQDTSEVTPEVKGNFYLSFIERNGKKQMLDYIVDPDVVFGHCSNFSQPQAFMDYGFDKKGKQFFENKSPSAMSYAELHLEKGASETLYSCVGHAGSVDQLNELLPSFCKSAFFIAKHQENEHVIRSLMDNCFVSSGSSAFDSYARQTFLDNLLRGGYPVTFEADGRKEVFYVYSRKHGDLERDYNNFVVMPRYFSQGNGNYRDINQNRRNDVWVNPDVGFSNVQYFLNLIQLDGHNPLVVKGLEYIYEKSPQNDDKVTSFVSSGVKEQLLELLAHSFVPHDLVSFAKADGIDKQDELVAFVSAVLTSSRKNEKAEHGEGYWVDHWFYNIDLLQSYEAVFPDKMRSLLWEENIFTYYDDAHFVLPRCEKYVLPENGEPRQYDSVFHDKEKAQLIDSRENEKNKVRVAHGRGEVYRTTLFEKLFTLGLCKIASLDSFGVGVEMESNKPGWNDSMNGMPGLFGSSFCETLALKRLLLKMQKWIVSLNLASEEISLPAEIYDFYNKVARTITGNLNGELSNYDCWDGCSSAKEMYRDCVQMGLSGEVLKMTVQEIESFINNCLQKIQLAESAAFNKKLGIYHTYFINKAVEFEKIESELEGEDQENNGSCRDKVRIKRFKQIPLAPYLETQMHSLLGTQEVEKAEQLYKSVKKTELYDKKLKMYKVNGSLADFPLEVGRVRVFSPGWLENESVFLHMHYKYLLALLKSGLHDEYFAEIKEGIVPFLDPEVYGRSIFENSSFIVSSVNHDERLHGRGFVARLSGSTAEFYNMIILMGFGSAPFSLNAKGELSLKFEPRLPAWLFSTEEKNVPCYIGGVQQEVAIGKDCFALNMLGGTLVVYHNQERLNTVGKNSVSVKRIVLNGDKGEKVIEGDVVSASLAEAVRDGKFKRIDIWLEK